MGFFRQQIFRSVLSGVFTAPFSPANLFAAGEQGAWYDPSDLSTMFQDSAGTTPVTAAGQPVGRILDKSGRGNHATQATTAQKPVLQTNGTQWWLQFDGVDDGLSTGSIDFTATDKMTEIVGARRNSATVGMLTEISTNAVAFAGAFYTLHGDRIVGWEGLSHGSAAATAAQIGEFAVPAPETSVLALLFDIAGDLSRVRRNGVVGTDGIGDQGAGNYGNYPLYIGRRAGTSLPFNGNIYSLIVRGAATTLADIQAAESFTADKTGITL